MCFAALGIIGIILCWKSGAWKDWKLYYSTILYFMVGDSIADLLLYNNMLWTYGSLIDKSAVLDISIMVLLYPSTVILYLAYYPNKAGKQYLYILLWVAIYSLTEYIACLIDGFSYHNHWSIWYSVLFNFLMFPLLRLHYKKPLLVWPISAALAFTVLWWFQIPVFR
jgi:hypothetical protein